MRGTSKERVYDKLGLETLEQRKYYRKLCCFFKIFRNKCPKYLFSIIPTSVSIYNTKNTNNIRLFKVKRNFFRNPFLSFCGNRAEQTGPKYSQFRKLEYLQENTFELYTSFWKYCFQFS